MTQIIERSRDVAPLDEAPPTTTAPAPRTLKERLFAPGWPLAWLLIGYPIWWILGLTEPATYVLTAFMAVALYRRGAVSVPRGFGMWLVFLGFTVVGVLVLQVDAPSAAPGTSGGRYLVWAFRLFWYLCATVWMLYVINLRREISLERVSRIFSWMFVIVVIGGILGARFPYVSFPSAIELIMPKSISSIGFVQQLVHPNLAEIQNVLGYVEARPSAPFAFTNTWGLAIACFLPFFVVSWFGKDAGWHKYVAPLVLLAALGPIVQSLNRGLWGAIIGMVVFVALRYAVLGRLRLLATMVVSVALVTGIVFATPLADTIALRWAHQHSNVGRTNLGTATVTSALDKSPVVGFGTTRQVQGSFNSISGGKTAACPHCSPPSLGTQGQVWLLIFAGGLGGLLSWVAFFGFAFLRSLRLRSPHATAALCVLLAHAITSVVYNVNGPGQLAILVAVAFLWRESSAPPGPWTIGALRRGDVSEHTLGHYLLMMRRHFAVIVVLGIVGVGAGAASALISGVPYRASIAIAVDDAQSFVANQPPLTLDTEAQYANTPRVLAAMKSVTGVTVAESDLLISATSNSRVIHIGWEGPTATKAQAGVKAAAQVFLAERAARLTTERQAAVTSLQAQVDAARTVLMESQDRQAKILLLPAAVHNPELRVLGLNIDRQIVIFDELSLKLARASNLSQHPGDIILTPPAQANRDGLVVAAASGLALAMLLAVALVVLGERVSLPAWSASTIRRRTGLPVVATMPSGLLLSGFTLTGVVQISSELLKLALLAVEGHAASKASV